MTGTVFSLAGTRAWTLVLGTSVALTLMAAPLQAEEDVLPPQGDTVYELPADPIDSPPVNYRSGIEEQYDTPEMHDAEMYAEEYERRQREEKIRNRDQLDRIDNFSSGAITTDGITPPR